MPEKKYCPNGHLMDQSWNVCPYCRGETAAAPGGADALKKTVREVAPGVPEPPAATPAPRKTMRLADERLPPVVGWLVDLDGRQKGRDFRIEEGKVTLGAATGCQICLDNSFASEQHASLRYADSEYVLTDLDSTNGTFVNGKRISRIALKDGDRIKIGETTYIFKGLFLKGGEA